jgi:hypothetical protein
MTIHESSKKLKNHKFCISFSGSSYGKIVRQPVTGKNDFPPGKFIFNPVPGRTKPVTGNFPGFPPYKYHPECHYSTGWSSERAGWCSKRTGWSFRVPVQSVSASCMVPYQTVSNTTKILLSTTSCINLQYCSQF